MYAILDGVAVCFKIESYAAIKNDNECLFILKVRIPKNPSKIASRVNLYFRYGQRIDMEDADSITIRKYLEEDDQYLEDKVRSYIATFNKVNENETSDSWY